VSNMITRKQIRERRRPESPATFQDGGNDRSKAKTKKQPGRRKSALCGFQEKEEKIFGGKSWKERL